MSVEDDSSISEINILPDGRVCLFGVSQQVLEMLDSISLGDPALRNRIDSLRTGEMCPAIDLNEICAEQDDGAVNNRVRL